MSGVLVAKTRGFWGQSIKLSVKEKLLVCGKGKLFQLMQSQPIKKSIFQHTKTSISHCTKANVQLQILSAKTYCELAVKQLFFRKTTVLRLHYGNPFAPIQSLYAAVLRAKPVSIRAAGKLYKITSGRALNRGRRTESRVLFGYFLHDAKSDNSFPFRKASRFSKPRSSPPQWHLRTATIKTFLRELRGLVNLESAH